MYNPYDHYFSKAKKKGYKARSAFKLEEIDHKYNFFSPQVHTVLDIGCAPGSRLQYAQRQCKQNNETCMIGFDIKKTAAIAPYIHTYEQDIQKREPVQAIIQSHNIEHFDVIMSDMAPNTTGSKSTDALRSIALLEETLWMYDAYTSPHTARVIKIFMGPGFENFCNQMKHKYGAKNIRIYKPQACRKNSKETYIIKTRQ